MARLAGNREGGKEVKMGARVMIKMGGIVEVWVPELEMHEPRSQKYLLWQVLD